MNMYWHEKPQFLKPGPHPKQGLEHPDTTPTCAVEDRYTDFSDILNRNQSPDARERKQSTIKVLTYLQT